MALKDITFNSTKTPIILGEMKSNDEDSIRMYYAISDEEGNGFDYCCVLKETAYWDEEDYTDGYSGVYILCYGWAAFDGIRHLHFVGDVGNDLRNVGYFNYPNIEEFKFCMETLYVLERMYCSDLK